MATDSATLTLAVVGATGAVGQEILTLLDQGRLASTRVKLLASSRSAGKQFASRGENLIVEQLTENSFQGVDLAIFSAGGSTSKAYAQAAVDAGCIVIDNSSAFRMDPQVPLVIPEVNPQALAGVRLGEGSIVANPNCSTIIMMMAVTPLHRAVGVKRIVVSTYQAASGAGAAAMAELETQTHESLAGTPPDQLTQEIFGRPYAFNLFSHNSPMQPNGYNEEEMKMVRESHKIWGDDSVRITATCIRVPVMRAHAESINLTLAAPLSEDEARELLASFPGVQVMDDRGANRFPEPLHASGQDDVFVGRVRHDLSQEPGLGLDLFCCGDQIRKGAALNAVQIAEAVVDSARSKA